MPLNPDKGFLVESGSRNRIKIQEFDEHKLHEKPTILRRKHKLFRKRSFLIFLPDRDPDPEPLTQLIPNLVQIRIRNTAFNNQNSFLLRPFTCMWRTELWIIAS